MNAPMTPERWALIRVLQDAVWPFLAHDPANPDVFWGQLARKIEEHYAAEVDRLQAEVAELDVALRYSNQAREIMRAEKEHGWREAEKHESRAERAVAERDRLRDRLRAQVTAVESLAEKIEATADQDEEAAASIGTSTGRARLQALADNGRWTVRALRALASGDEVQP